VVTSQDAHQEQDEDARDTGRCPGDLRDPGTYGRTWAADYDTLYEHRDDVATVVALVTKLAGGGRILELGVGTGRLALPLATAGFSVTGVDASPEMLERLRARPGADRVQVIEGDFTTVDAGGPFDVALIAFSTLFLVPSQEGQLSCLANVRRHLRPGGHLLVEAFVPDHSRWTRGQNLSVGRLDDDTATLKLSVHDPVHQVITSQDVIIGVHGVSLRPSLLRYVWPAELDAMALVNRLRLVRRTSDWAGAPFTAASTSHVSTYRHSPLPGERMP
jgi:SAM-dependent methyltransferase